MAEKFNHENPKLISQLGMTPFQQRMPWFGGDLQTIRDTFIKVKLPADQGQPVEIPVPALASGAAGSGRLLAMLDYPTRSRKPRAVIILLHGLGGSSRREGLRRMAIAFQQAGFAVLRLNLRGADPGRNLAGGTYAAECNSDLLPVLLRARQLCRELVDSPSKGSEALPLFGAGLSLGGTILLNACLRQPQEKQALEPLLDGLVCISSPLDLAACSNSIERPRNSIYQHWLLKRLVRQTLADPFGVSAEEKRALSVGKGPPTTIRAFDAAITAPRWGYENVDAYYNLASPLGELLDHPRYLPKTLLMQAFDDPWVPVFAAQQLADQLIKSSEGPLKVVLTKKGGHNGFHGKGGCWGDDLAVNWLTILAEDFADKI